MSFLVVQRTCRSGVLNGVESCWVHVPGLLALSVGVSPVSIGRDELIHLLDLLVKDHVLRYAATLFIIIKSRI
jgi:hypothetical protein